MEARPILWIVIPCYNEEQVLPITAPMFLKKVTDLAAAGKISKSSRVLFVNDGSKDKTWEIIKDLSRQDEHYIGICQSRNRGHQNAVLAGLMLDEMEKADPSITNLFLQVMSAGVLTDQSGKRADFRNIILIMTSNVGSRDMERSRPGFATPTNAVPVREDDRDYREAFSPEFRNRIDKRVRFQPLQPEHMLRIFDKFLGELGTALAERKITLSATDEVREDFARRGFDPKFGARPMNRLISDEIRQPLAQALVSDRLPNGSHVTLRLQDGHLVFDGMMEPPNFILVSRNSESEPHPTSLQ